MLEENSGKGASNGDDRIALQGPVNKQVKAMPRRLRVNLAVLAALGLDVRVGIIADQAEIVVAEIQDRSHIVIDLQARQRPGVGVGLTLVRRFAELGIDFAYPTQMGFLGGLDGKPVDPRDIPTHLQPAP